MLRRHQRFFSSLLAISPSSSSAAVCSSSPVRSFFSASSSDEKLSLLTPKKQHNNKLMNKPTMTITTTFADEEVDEINKEKPTQQQRDVNTEKSAATDNDFASSSTTANDNKIAMSSNSQNKSGGSSGDTNDNKTSSTTNDPFSKPKLWEENYNKNKSSHSNNYHNTNNHHRNKKKPRPVLKKEEIQKARKSLLDQFPELFSTSSSPSSSNNHQHQQQQNRKDVMNYLSPRTQQELQQNDTQYQVRLKEVLDDDYHDNDYTNNNVNNHQLAATGYDKYRSLNFPDPSAKASSSSSSSSSSSADNIVSNTQQEDTADDGENLSSPASLLAHPEDVELSEYQKKLLSEKRAEEYSVLRRNFIKVFEGHHTLESKCHLLAALHTKTIERKMRLSTDIYEDFFLTFVRYGDSIMNTTKEGRVLPHYHPSSNSSTESSKRHTKNRISTASTITSFGTIQKQLQSIAFNNNNNNIKITNNILKARTSCANASDFGFSEVVWSAYNYMLASGTQPSHRTLQHMMKCLQYGGVQGGKSELERRAHQLMLENCDSRVVAARNNNKNKNNNRHRNAVVPSVYTLISYIEICSQVGAMHVALGVYVHALNEFRLAPNASITTVILNGFLRNHLKSLLTNNSNNNNQTAAGASSPSSYHHLDSALRFMKHVQAVPLDIYLLNTMLNVLRHSKDPISTFSAMRVVTGEEGVMSKTKEQVVLPIQAHTITTLLEAWKNSFQLWFPDHEPAIKMNKHHIGVEKKNIIADSSTTTSSSDNRANNDDDSTNQLPAYLLRHLTADDDNNNTDGDDTYDNNQKIDQRRFNDDLKHVQVLARELRYIITLTVQNKIRTSESTSNKILLSANLLQQKSNELQETLLYQKKQFKTLMIERINNNNSRGANEDKEEEEVKKVVPSSLRKKMKRSEAQLEVLKTIDKHFQGLEKTLKTVMAGKGVRVYS